MEQLQPGQMLGPYRIINQIGQGGMATVYKAYQASMDRNVAIKVLPGQLAESREFTQRFQQEAHIIAKLEHPHILPVFDYGESEGVTYLVMRYLDAGTLRDKMENGRPLPLDEIDRLFTQLADALGYAHSFGIVHRDLKPSNALIDAQGNLFLTDFGIAKMLESASPRLTQTDAIMGTPAYISPEQAQAAKVDQRSDIYSLGIILYEMVTGRVPFVAETPLAVILKHVSDPLPPPSTLKPDIPEVIERVILKALAKHPEDRFATVGEFLAAWKRALDETRTSRPAAPLVDAGAAVERKSTPQPQRAPVADARQGISAPKAAPKPQNWTGWVVGCLVGVCALFGIGGTLILLSNLREPSAPAPTLTISPTQTPLATLILPPPPTLTVPPAAGETLLQDDFSDDSIWGILNEETASIAYENNALRMRVFRTNWIVWSTPNVEAYRNVRAEVTARNNDGETTTAFGIICYQQEVTSSYYYAVVTPAGEYAIAKAADGETDTFLTNNDAWGSSSLIATNASSYRLGLDCGNGALSLYVDGQLIDSVLDDTYTSGTSGLIVWSGNDVSSADVTFDDFILRALE
ncbi:MAG: protein kinase [Anaerolineales bacterium]|nr:protein kinase [Anaerolineales bacterium]NUQ84820.1 serine/threonine protein kinase [Anaerolineales bacterium]